MDHTAPADPVSQSAASAVVDAVEAEASLLLEQLQTELTHARPAPEPGMRQGEVLNLTLDLGGGVMLPVPQTATVDSQGYVWLYDTRSGEPSRCPANQSMLKQQIKKLRPERDGGGRMFTTIPPEKWAKPPVRYVGTIKCRLHADDPERAKWNALRLPTCNKSNLTSQYEQERHMASKHKREWATIEAERNRLREEREWAWREKVLSGTINPAVLAATEPTPTPGPVTPARPKGRPKGRAVSRPTPPPSAPVALAVG